MGVAVGVDEVFVTNVVAAEPDDTGLLLGLDGDSIELDGVDTGLEVEGAGAGTGAGAGAGAEPSEAPFHTAGPGTLYEVGSAV